jgi:hypothetical protein
MAITKTKTLVDIRIWPAVLADGPSDSNDSYSSVAVTYLVSIDDPDDSELPIENYVHTSILKYDSEGVVSNYSSEASLVQIVCDAIWI